MAFTPFVETDQPTMASFNEKFQQAIQDATAQGLKIEVVTYIGTGTYGQDNPTSISFSFVPKMVIIIGVGAYGGFIDASRLTNNYMQSVYSTGESFSMTYSKGYGKIEGTTISLYTTDMSYSGPTNQFNQSQYMYTAFAIGSGV